MKEGVNEEGKTTGLPSTLQLANYWIGEDGHLVEEGILYLELGFVKRKQSLMKFPNLPFYLQNICNFHKCLYVFAYALFPS